MKAAPYCQSLVLISLLGVTAPAAIAQPITPAKDGTGTIINRSGDRFDITGGSLSNNEANLFHSFQQLSLDAGQTANFISAPNIQNILGRVTGGNASIINGLIQVSGGQSNLYLMNPAGVLFGPNARLDVPASFSVTTATGIGLGNNWFNAVGTNDYQNLVGTPNRYRFDVVQPGAIVNSGDLELSPEQNLTLVGGTVINTGRLSTPGGNVTIAAVEGGDTIRISQPGHLLSLEISNGSVGETEGISPLSLPALLTEGNFSDRATGMTVNENGQVVLTGSRDRVSGEGVAIASGTIDVSGNVGGEVNVIGSSVGTGNINADGNVTLQADSDITVNEAIETSESVELKAGRSININADIDSSRGNGNIALFANDNNVNIANRSSGAANITQRDGTTLNAGSGNIRMRLGSLGEVGDINLANLTTGGRVNINANGGNIGQVSVHSLLAAGEVILRTSGRGGIGLSGLPLRVDVDNLEAVSGRDGAFFDALGRVTVGGVSDRVSGLSTTGGGDVELSAERKITVKEDISTTTLWRRAGNIEIESRSGGIDATAARINTYSLWVRGGDISLTAARNVRTADIYSSGHDKRGGDINVVSREGGINTTEGTIEASSYSGDGGTIEMEAAGDITTADITTASGRSSVFGSGNGGNIILNSRGNINTAAGIVDSSSMGGDGGNVTLRSGENINVHRIYSSSYERGNGGSIDINSGGNINTNYNFEVSESKKGVISSSSSQGNGGDISLRADRDVNLDYIFSFSSESGNGGSIDLNSGGDVLVRNWIISGSVGGNGGDISVTAGRDIQINHAISASGDIQIGITFDLTPPGNPENRENSENNKFMYKIWNTYFSIVNNEDNIMIGRNRYMNISNDILNSGPLRAKESRGNNLPVPALLGLRLISLDEVTCFCAAPNGGNGGNIDLRASRDITTAIVSSYANGNGSAGDITLKATDGNIDTTAGQIVSGSSNGNGGTIDFNAGGDILTGDLFSRSQNRDTGSFGEGRGGNINLRAEGNIDTTGGQISSVSNGDGGDVSIESRDGNIETAEIFSFSKDSGVGGDINLEAEGNITTTDGDLNSQSGNRGGNIEITTDGNVNTGNVKSSGDRRSGNIDINSTDGRINTTSGRLNSSSDGGIGSDISLEAEGRINTGNVIASGTRRGGNISITSNNGNIDTTAGELKTTSNNGTGGDVRLEAEGRIDTANAIASRSQERGNIMITSNSDDVDTTAGELETTGRIEITTGNGSITTGNIRGSRNITIEDGGENNPFRNRPNANTRTDSDRLNQQSGEVTLQAHNDVTINESIETTEVSRLEIKAGRNININADIDTSANNGDIALRANSQEANPNLRGAGTGNVNMAPGTILNAGSGAIAITLETGEIGQVGNINLANLTTTGNVMVDASGGNIFRVSENSLITAGNAAFQTRSNGAIGLPTEPLRLQVNNVEARVGTGGAFFNSPNSAINIGDASREIDGILITNGGDLEITTEAGDITATENISTTNGNSSSEARSGNITLNAAGNIDATQVPISTFANSRGGSATLNATGDVSTGLIDTGGINGQAGNITINAGGAINTTAGELQANSNTSNGGNISLTANGGILTSRVTSTSFSGGDGGNIRIESTNGSITTGSLTESLPADAEITNPEIVNRFEDAQANLDAKAEDGSGGSIELKAKGDITTGNISSRGEVNGGNVSINSEAGNINIGIIFTVAGTGSGGNIDLTAGISDNSLDATRTASQITDAGNINANHLASYSSQGSGGDITINATGSFNVNQLASFGLLQSGDVFLNSSNNSINTGNITTQSEGGPSGNISANGTDVGTGNARTLGTTEAGQIRIEATDGSITTLDLESISTEGEAGGIDLDATENIETGDQTVVGAEGDANIDVDAGENTSIADQTATTGDGNANINLNTGGNASTENQTATTGNGNANIQVRSGGDIRGENQAAIANNGNASIGTEAGGSVNLRDQLARATGGNASIANTAEDNIGISNDQTASATEGNGSIDNQAGGSIGVDGSQTATGDNASINNVAGDNINVGGDQAVTATGGNASIDNQAGENIGVGGSQSATATGGNSSINNVAGNNIDVGGSQTATATGGNASINNQAGNNINVGSDQAATAAGGDATINNVAGDNIAVGNQTAVSDGGNASINNDAGGSLTMGGQAAIAPDGIATINNNLPNVEEIIPSQGSVTLLPNNNPVLSVENNAIGGGSGVNSAPATTNLPPVNPSRGNLQPNNSATPLNFNPTLGIAPNIRNTILPQSSNVPTPVEFSPQPSSVSTPLEVSPQFSPTLNNTLPETAIAPTSISGVSSNLDNTDPVFTLDSGIRNVVTENTRTSSNPDAVINNIDGEMNSNTSTEKTLQKASILNSFNLTVEWELGENSQELIDLEESRIREYVDYLGEDILDPDFYLKNPQEILADMARQTGHQSAVIYVTAYDDGLQLVLYTATGDPIMRNDYSIKKDEILKMAEAFKQLMSNPNKIGKQDYFQQAQKFYNLLIRPIQRDLDAANIDTLLFSMGSGLRRLPLAALHDGQQFLVEKYGLSMIPSISLMDSRYRNLEGTRVLGMGVEYFEKKESLPAVSLELKIIEDFRPSDTFINEEFTRDNLIAQRQNYPYEIIHLATHSNIDQHHPQSSYIQLWDDETLGLNQIRELGWNQPPVELLILSSCRAVVENKDAELGFAGLAVATGVKSAIAGLWAVNDRGTLALMSEFYNNLDDVTIKAEALRKAQLAMIRGEVKIENGQLWISGQDSPYPLPPELKRLENLDLSHPYYWSAFTIIGSPW